MKNERNKETDEGVEWSGVERTKMEDKFMNNNNILLFIIYVR